jgi:phosphoserine phosphatase RsbU/P
MMPMTEIASAAGWIVTCAGDGLRQSGDFIDYIDCADGRRAVLLGDIAGRGPDLGGVAESLRAYLHLLVNDGCRPEPALQACNRFFWDTIGPRKIPFASVFLAVASMRGQTLTYASAGHETALVFDSQCRHEHLSPGGPLLGVFCSRTTSFTEREIPFDDGQLLVVVSDGITDARPASGCREFFGTSGVVRAVVDARARSGDVATAIHQAAIAHAGGTLSDDATVMTLYREGPR